MKNRKFQYFCSLASIKLVHTGAIGTCEDHAWTETLYTLKEPFLLATKKKKTIKINNKKKLTYIWMVKKFHDPNFTKKLKNKNTV